MIKRFMKELEFYPINCVLISIPNGYGVHAHSRAHHTLTLDYKSHQITNEKKNDQDVLCAGRVFLFDTL